MIFKKFKLNLIHCSNICKFNLYFSPLIFIQFFLRLIFFILKSLNFTKLFLPPTKNVLMISFKRRVCSATCLVDLCWSSGHLPCGHLPPRWRLSASDPTWIRREEDGMVWCNITSMWPKGSENDFLYKKIGYFYLNRQLRQGFNTQGSTVSIFKKIVLEE